VLLVERAISVMLYTPVEDGGCSEGYSAHLMAVLCIDGLVVGVEQGKSWAV
jgi:hypothetical protein